MSASTAAQAAAAPAGQLPSAACCSTQGQAARFIAVTPEICRMCLLQVYALQLLQDDASSSAVPVPALEQAYTTTSMVALHMVLKQQAAGAGARAPSLACPQQHQGAPSLASGRWHQEEMFKRHLEQLGPHPRISTSGGLAHVQHAERSVQKGHRLHGGLPQKRRVPSAPGQRLSGGCATAAPAGGRLLARPAAAPLGGRRLRGGCGRCCIHRLAALQAPAADSVQPLRSTQWHRSVHTAEC